MQIEADQRVCPACGAEGLEMFPVLHHMMCAYVGPQYDFAAALDGYTCPKCRRAIVSGDHACEIVGTSARCVDAARRWWFRHPNSLHRAPSEPNGRVVTRRSFHSGSRS